MVGLVPPSCRVLHLRGAHHLFRLSLLLDTGSASGLSHLQSRCREYTEKQVFHLCAT